MRDFFELTARLRNLQTSRLALREASPADGWALFNATRNPEFNRLLMWPRPERAEQAVQRMEAICLAQSRGRMSAISACLKETGVWVALFRFQPYALDPEITEMGLWMHPDYWSSSFGKELTQTCIDAAFSAPDTGTLLAAASPQNTGALKVLLRCGMLFSNKVFRGHEDGTTVELLEHRITRQAWLQRQAPDWAQGTPREMTMPLQSFQDAQPLGAP